MHSLIGESPKKEEEKGRKRNETAGCWLLAVGHRLTNRRMNHLDSSRYLRGTYSISPASPVLNSV